MDYSSSIPLPVSASNSLLQQGYIHVGNALQSCLDQHEDFLHFKKSWDDLPADNYLNDSGKYRYRRYAVFQYLDGELSKSPLEPHYQTLKYNNLHGGLYRHFSEIEPSEIENPILKNLIKWNLGLISTTEQKNWRIQCHQFRISTTEKEVGKPSPEGIHQDGADYVFIMLLDRYNVVGASNTIHDKSGHVLFETTLTQPGESILLNDKRHWHGVSNLYPKDTTKQNAYRDVLVLTFHHLEQDND